MKGMNLIAMAVVAIFCMFFGSVAFAEDHGSVVTVSPSISSSSYLPDAHLRSHYLNLGYDDGTLGISISASMDLENHLVQGAGWYFYTDPWDTSRFHAELTASGMLLGDGLITASDPLTWSTEYETRYGVDMNSRGSLNFYEAADPNDSYASVAGSLNLSPAVVTMSLFHYDEYPDYDWNPDGGGYYETDDTRWNAFCRFDGRFVADTPEEARAMGAPFASVPEPSAIVLMVMGVISGIAVYLRRRHA
jgi:hypothetical protein